MMKKTKRTKYKTWKVDVPKAWKKGMSRVSQVSSFFELFGLYTPTKKGQEYSLIVGNKKFVGLEAKYLRDYIQSITSKSKRPFNLKYLNKSANPSTIEDYAYEINKARFLSDKSNHDTLIDINQIWLNMNFGNSYSYGIPHSFKISDIPNIEPTHSDENFVFIHGDNYFDALLDAPKYFIENWQKRVDTCQVSIKTRKCLLKIDGEILLGEFCKETQKSFDSVAPGSKSGIKFSIYYQGREDAKFTVDRWDYLPLSEHRNKFTENGDFCPFGVIVPKTQLSHRHPYRLLSRLVLTQNQSADIEPTIINSLGFEEEIPYNNFQDMCSVAEMFWNVQPGMIPIHELQNRTLTKIGKLHCMEYNRSIHTIQRHKDFVNNITDSLLKYSPEREKYETLTHFTFANKLQDKVKYQLKSDNLTSETISMDKTYCEDNNEKEKFQEEEEIEKEC